MKKSLILLFCLFGIYSTSKGQVGFLGKRFVVKTNALSGTERLFGGFELEYVIKRNLTFCVGYRSDNYSSDFNFNDFQNINSWLASQDYFYSGDGELKFDNVSYSQPSTNTVAPGFKNSVKDGVLKSVRRVYDFSFRLYSNSYASAPFGFYTQYGFGIGSQTYEGGLYYPNDIREVYDGNITRVNFYSESFERYKKKERLINLQFGLGYQYIFSKWITLDFNLNMGAGVIGTSTLPNNNSYGNDNLSIILGKEKRFSKIGNLLGNGSNETSSSAYSYNNPQSAFFVSGYVKLGILIF